MQSNYRIDRELVILVRSVNFEGGQHPVTLNNTTSPIFKKKHSDVIFRQKAISRISDKMEG